MGPNVWNVADRIMLGPISLWPCLVYSYPQVWVGPVSSSVLFFFFSDIIDKHHWISLSYIAQWFDLHIL